MSFGFGFALPAYPLRGGGGNNPFNQDGPTLDMSFVDGATNVGDQLGADTYTLNTDFITPEYQVAAQYAVWVDGSGLTQRNFADIVTFTRASTGTYFNSAGTLTTAAINEARFDYDPATLAARGLLIEEQRTNSIRNNTMVGAVAGTPGTLPTNWTASNLGTLVREVVGTGTVNGINYVDIRLSGTTSTTSAQIFCEPATGGPSASSGQTWSTSNFLAIVGGSLTNITTIRAIQLQGRDGAGAATENFNSGDQKALLTSSMQRFSLTSTLANASTTTLQPGISPTFNSGVAIDITIRIGLPQLELGAFATSVIPTTTTALTRSADVATVNTLSPWYNATEGTLYGEMETLSTSEPNQLLSFNDGTNSNRMELRLVGITATSVRADCTVSGVIKFSSNVTVANTELRKGALAIKANDFRLQSGAAGISPVSDAVPTVDRLYLNYATFAGGEMVGWLRRITYYPRRLSNADLQTITA